MNRKKTPASLTFDFIFSFIILNYTFTRFLCPESKPASDICMGDMCRFKATEENQETSVKTTSETTENKGKAFIIWSRRQASRKHTPPPLSNQPFEISSMPLNFPKEPSCALQRLPSLHWPGQWKMAS